MLVNELLEESPELIGLLDQSVHSLSGLFDQSMVLIHFRFQDVFDVFLHIVHLVSHLLVLPILLVVNLHFIVDLSHDIVHSAGNCLVHLLEIHLLVI